MPHLKRPSPALVISILALVAAIVVPAYALTKSEKRVVRKVANTQITKRAPGLAVASAQSAEDATNAAKVDEADVCSGTVSLQSSGQQTVCSAGPLSIVAVCAISGASTTARVDLVSTGDSWAFGERMDAPAAESPIAETSLSSPFTIAEGLDGNASSLVYDGSSAWISAGTPGGSSLGGAFSLRANHTGASQGTCLVSTGAIAR